MRPIALTIEGLRSFRAPVIMDFSGREHVAIVGDTGAGKSSILEAITYALYGQTTFTAQGNQELMNDTSMHLRVVLRFRVSGETWEVARALKRDGLGKVWPAGTQLRRIGECDETIEQVEQVKPVNERIKKLLGLDSDAFLRTVVLPQGRFARLLVEDRPTERAEILRQIWRTDELAEAGALAATALEQARDLLMELEQATSHHPKEPAAHLAQLTSDHERAREEARAAIAAAKKVGAAHKGYHDANRVRAAANQVIERLRAPVTDRAAERLETITVREREIAAEDMALVQRQADVATRLAEIPDDTDGPGVPEVASALATLPAIGPLVNAAEAAADEARQSDDADRRATENARRTAELAAAAEERNAQHAERRPALADAVADASDRRATLGRLYDECRTHQEALEGTQAALADLRNERAACAAQLDAARAEARRDETAATEASERLQAARHASETNAATYTERKQRLLEALAEADKRCLTIRQRYDECRARAHAAKEAEQTITELREHREALTRRMDTADAEARDAGRRRQEAEEHAAAVRRSESAAAAARDLHSGDACPICDRELPGGWKPPASTGLHEAIAAEKRARKAADDAGNHIVALTTERTGVERQLGKAQIRARGAGDSFTAALKALAGDAGIDAPATLPDRDGVLGPLDTALRAASDAVDRCEREHAVHVETLAQRERAALETWEAAQRVSVTTGQRVAALVAGLEGLERKIDSAVTHEGTAADARAAGLRTLGEAAGIALADALPARDVLLGPFDASVRDASDVLAQHDRQHAALQNELNRCSSASAAAAGAATGARALAKVKQDGARSALARVREAIATVPASFRPRLDLPADPAGLQRVDTTAVGERTASAEAREQTLGGRATERRRLQKEVAAAQNGRDALARRKAAQVNDPISDIVNDLNEHRSTLLKAVWDLDLDEGVPPLVAPGDTRALRSLIEALRATTLQVTRAAHEHADSAAARADAARAELAVFAARVENVDSDDLDAIVEAARTAAGETRVHERQARNAANQFAAIIDHIQLLHALREEAADKKRILTDLDNALKPGAFPKWLTLRRSRDLLVHASRMLGTMSGGRYAFVDPQDTAAQWRVLDRDSGQARSPASLSGGEQFIASLSLALGMVEMMARSGGRLESLFLDEGFGSLDRNNLDTAVEALSTVAAGGRMVGVISHVRAVAEQIEHVLAVTRHATGSRVEWLTGTERQRLSESDTGLAGASALAGLLE